AAAPTGKDALTVQEHEFLLALQRRLSVDCIKNFVERQPGVGVERIGSGRHKARLIVVVDKTMSSDMNEQNFVAAAEVIEPSAGGLQRSMKIVERRNRIELHRHQTHIARARAA